MQVNPRSLLSNSFQATQSKMLRNRYTRIPKAEMELAPTTSDDISLSEASASNNFKLNFVYTHCDNFGVPFSNLYRVSWADGSRPTFQTIAGSQQAATHVDCIITPEMKAYASSLTKHLMRMVRREMSVAPIRGAGGPDELIKAIKKGQAITVRPSVIETRKEWIILWMIKNDTAEVE
jgi:hypothetical protein